MRERDDIYSINDIIHISYKSVRENLLMNVQDGRVGKPLS